jgi:hypothetical protein
MLEASAKVPKQSVSYGPLTRIKALGATSSENEMVIAKIGQAAMRAALA